MAGVKGKSGAYKHKPSQFGNVKGKHWKVKDTSRMNKSKIGKKRPPRSKEWSEKISKAKIGKPNPKLSLAKKGKSHKNCNCPFCKSKRGEYLGINSPNWKGGISFLPYSTDWTETLKTSIRERDNYICQLCFKKQESKTFHIHHIDYNKKNCNPSNLITLCHNCHMKTNTKRDYWTNYFKNL